MAGPLVIAGEAAASAGGRAAWSIGKQKLKDLLISLGLWEGVQAAADYAPDILDKMYSSMTSSGVTPDQAEASKDGGRKVALIETARQGIYLDESSGLTKGEASKYKTMLKQFGIDLSKAADAAQVKRPAVEDPRVAEAQYTRAMVASCNRLGLTGPNRFRELYDIATVINTIREKDVENAELTERFYGTIR